MICKIKFLLGIKMKVKIIKKENNSKKEINQVLLQSELNNTQNAKKKIKENILNWVSELRDKKRFELVQTQTMFNNFR